MLRVKKILRYADTCMVWKSPVFTHLRIQLQGMLPGYLTREGYQSPPRIRLFASPQVCMTHCARDDQILIRIPGMSAALAGNYHAFCCYNCSQGQHKKNIWVDNITTC
jgi:hypothetical protein